MALISDYKTQELTDAIAKLYYDAQAALVPTVDLYDRITYTEDQDIEDLLPGAEAADDAMADGENVAKNYEDVVDDLSDHVKGDAVDAGYDSLDDYLTGRRFRVDRSFADVARHLGETLTPVNVCPSKTTLGSFAYGGSYEESATLEATLEELARIVVEVVTGIGPGSYDLDWDLDVECIDSGPQSPLAADLTAADTTITVDDTTDFPASGTVQVGDERITITDTGRSATVLCTDATRGADGTVAAAHSTDDVVRLVQTHTVTISHLLAAGGQTDLLAKSVSGTSRSGQAVVAVSGPAAAGLAAGQSILLLDDTYPRKLTADLGGAGVEISVEDTWPYVIGDSVLLHDDVTGDSAAVTVADVDRKGLTITVDSAPGAFLTAQRAHLRLAAAAADGRGNCEVGTIASVASNSITLDDNLRNTYYTSGVIHLLVYGILDVATSGFTGQIGDEVEIKAMPDRTIAK